MSSQCPLHCGLGSNIANIVHTRELKLQLKKRKFILMIKITLGNYWFSFKHSYFCMKISISTFFSVPFFFPSHHPRQLRRDVIDDDDKISEVEDTFEIVMVTF